MFIRELTEWNEKYTLSKNAKMSFETDGREVAEEPDSVRTEFQRDRDRIIHSSSFRRLAHKTQVFAFPKTEHIRTRLTHTLEVAQIARTVARAMRLNEDLTEAIALGHDLGHSPFGHNGEHALNKISSTGFIHAAQSVRTAQFLEKDGKGLNLTAEVMDGIINHSVGMAKTLEGRVVKYCDKLAYINHDIEDAKSFGILTNSDLPKRAVVTLGYTKSERITTLVNSLITYYYSRGEEDIGYTEEIDEVFSELRDFMFKNVYMRDTSYNGAVKAEYVIFSLYGYYINTRGASLDGIYKRICETEGPERAITDYIAGMTDRYAVDKFNELFVPNAH
ncbi:MAG: deoxyguanosinetriphosphate triphosphohydrolase [Oscillospiraceae bacterium]|jgi:dGTPase|nr:deoxyguanosinetriphosphate triphosphohydrolase [Oscillospiraceae bacterium]